ncbi:N2-acetyl-L-ornithine:2-oxoglutarate 5-aminotransferase [Aureococcus anophagefferens]|uniref:N2-acetyl-L-ornithine:2-oxoglutarate 5-aminotransferase n=1 Tax=Aureococcus anophagefferens TaxID=44056 RepID=A0ABR1G1N9_AURAN
MLRSMRRIPARPPRLARRRASSSSLLQEPPPYEHPAVARAWSRGVDAHVAADKRTLWHPYTSMAAPAPALAVARASGVTLELECGARLVDGMSSWWACVHGYGVPELDGAAHEQLSRMSHVMFGGLTHRPAVALGDALVDVAPAGLEKVFLCDSGSVAVEVALKMAAQYWRGRGRPARTRVVALRGGYHGDTFGAMAVCDPDTGMHAAFGRRRQRSSSAAARPRAVCEAHDALFVADEIATGFGRAGRGHAFACDRAGVAPDIMCVGKALTGGYCTLERRRDGEVAKGAGADAIEAQLAAELAPAAALPAVADVRVLGAIGVVELHRPLDAAAVSAACADLGEPQRRPVLGPVDAPAEHLLYFSALLLPGAPLWVTNLISIAMVVNPIPAHLGYGPLDRHHWDHHTRFNWNFGSSMLCTCLGTAAPKRGASLSAAAAARAAEARNQRALCVGAADE